MLKRVISFFMSMLIVLTGLPICVNAETIDNNAVVYYGDATVMEDQSILLTECKTWRSGSVWFKNPIKTGNGVTVEFSYWAGEGRGNSYGGADGILCSFAEKSGLGASGMDIGFVGGESYAVEIDSYSNPGKDPSGKHFGIVYKSIHNHLTTYSSDCTDDSQWHTMRIVYKKHMMTVYLDDAQIMECDNVKMKDEVYLGFTAATGDGYNKHIVQQIKVLAGTTQMVIPDPDAEQQDASLEIVGEPYEFAVGEPFQIQAIYKGSRPYNFEALIDDQAGFTDIKFDPPMKALEDNYYIIRTTGVANTIGEYDFTLRNGDLSDTVRVSVTEEGSSKEELPSDLRYQAEILLSDYLPLSVSEDTYPATVIKAYLDLDTPSQQLMKAAYEEDLNLSVKGWRGVQIVSDFLDNPIKGLETIVKPMQVYEAVIMAVIQETVNLDLINDLNESVVRDCDSLLTDVTEIMKTAHDVDLKNYDSLKSAIKDKNVRKEVQQETQTWFAENFPEITWLDSFLEGMTTAFDISETFEDYFDTLVNSLVLAIAGDEIRAVIEECNRNCGTDNFALKEAFGSIQSSFEMGAIIDLINKEAAVLGKLPVKVIAEKLWEEVKAKFPPNVLILMAIFDTEKVMVNAVLRCDDITDAYLNLKSISEVEEVFRKALNAKEDNYIEYRNDQSAGEYLTALELTFSAIDLGCTNAYRFVNVIDEAPWTSVVDTYRWLKHVLKGEEYTDNIQKSKEAISNIQAGFKDTYDRQTKAWIDYMIMGYNPFTYEFDWFGKAPKIDPFSYLRKLFRIFCPVDVYVYNSENELAAAVVDGRVTNKDDENLLIGRFGDTKIVGFLTDQEYSIKYVGTDNGTMDIEISEFNENREVIREEFYDNLPLENGTEYTMAVPEYTEETYSLEDSNSTVIAPAYDTLQGNIYHAQIRNGVFAGDGADVTSEEIPANKEVGIYTLVPEGFTFLHWSASSNAVQFKDPYALETSFIMPAEDVIIEGIFEEPENRNPETITLSSSSMVLNAGDAMQIRAGIDPYYAKDKSVVWTSSNESVAAVDELGIITGMKPGRAVIKAKTSNGLTAECEVQILFTDIADNQYYHAPVYWAVENGITNGYRDEDGIIRTFKPQNDCTREAVVTFLWRLAGKPEPQNMNSPFSDVQDQNKYYYKAVLWAAELGITKGYADGTFKPNATCLREHVVTFLYRYAGKPNPGVSKNPFNDISSSDYYYSAALWANAKGIAKGYSSGEYKGGFGPKLDCLREHVVTFLYRYNK